MVYYTQEKGKEVIDMKFAIYRTSSDGCEAIRNFNTVEELIRFKKQEKHSIIIMGNPAYRENVKIVKKWNPKVDTNELIATPYAVEIYDDYRE